MIILVFLAIIWIPYVAAKLHARPARESESSPASKAPTVHAEAAPTDQRSPDIPVWSALDDRQLTRLLTDAAPRTTTEGP